MPPPPEFVSPDVSAAIQPTQPKKNWLLWGSSLLMELAVNIWANNHAHQFNDLATIGLGSLGAIPAIIATFRYERFLKAKGRLFDGIKAHPISSLLGIAVFFLLSCFVLEPIIARPKTMVAQNAKQVLTESASAQGVPHPPSSQTTGKTSNLPPCPHGDPATTHISADSVDSGVSLPANKDCVTVYGVTLHPAPSGAYVRSGGTKQKRLPSSIQPALTPAPNPNAAIPAINDHSIINNAPNLGDQKVIDARTYAGDGPVPELVNVKETPFAELPPLELPVLSPNATDYEKSLWKQDAIGKSLRYQSQNPSPGITFTFHVRSLFARAAFMVTCDKPCIHGGMAYTYINGSKNVIRITPLYSGPNSPIFAAQTMDYLTPDVEVGITVYSVSKSPLLSATLAAVVLR